MQWNNILDACKGFIFAVVVQFNFMLEYLLISFVSKHYVCYCRLVCQVCFKNIIWILIIPVCAGFVLYLQVFIVQMITANVSMD